MKTIKILILIIANFLLALALRWNSLSLPLIRDEGEYAYAAMLLKQGIIPYTHAFMQKPPLIIYSYLLSYLVTPNLYWAPRVLAALFVALAAVILGLIVKRNFGRGAAIVAMALFSVMVLLPNLEQFTANTEMFLLLPLLGLVAIVATGRRNKWTFLLAGFLAVTTLLYKPNVFPIILFIFGVWFYEKIRLVTVITGSLIAAAIFLAPLLPDGGLVSLKNILVYDTYYATATGGGLTAVWDRLLGLVTNWWPLFILLGWFFYRRPKRWWFYGGLLATAAISTSGSPYGHYYIILMPFWAAISAIALSDIAHVKITFLALSLIVLSIVGWSLKDWLLLSPANLGVQKLAGQPFLESQAVAAQLSTITKPGDKVFIAGSEPQILYYAKRQSASRFVIMYPLTIPTPLAEGYQKEAILELTKNPPTAIVLVNTNYSWLRNDKSPTLIFDFLNNLLNTKYQLVGGSNSLLLYKLNGS